MARSKGIALFDDTHGQPNWSQPDRVSSRELNTNFSGIADALADLGFDCSAVRPRLLGEVLPRSQRLVLPRPTGYYDPERECWHFLPSSRLTATEVETILRSSPTAAVCSPSRIDLVTRSPAQTCRIFSPVSAARSTTMPSSTSPDCVTITPSNSISKRAPRRSRSRGPKRESRRCAGARWRVFG